MKQKSILFGLCGMLILTFFCVLTIGPVSIPIKTVVRIFLSKICDLPRTWPDNFQSIILFVRLPRTLLGILVGCALSVSGCAMQGLFRNPMADSYICGIASAGAFGASLVIISGIGRGLIMPVAFSFSLLAIFVVYYLARTGRRVTVETLLLSGIAISLFFSALTSFIHYISKEWQLREMIFWIMGGLWKSDWNRVMASFPIIAVGTLGLIFFHRELNILLTSEEQAQDMGVEVEKTRKILLILSAFVSSAAVAVSGIIGFVGLIIPHTIRLIIGPDHKFLLPASCLAGGIFLVWVDTICRTIISPSELPVGIITALFGVPFFLYLLKKRKKSIGFY